MSDGLLEHLRARFRETTAVRLQEVTRLLDTLDSGGADDGDVVERLSRHFHALAGLGATYGYPRVSELGDHAEGAILALRKSGAAPSAEQVAWWRALMLDVEAALEEHHDAPLPPGQPAARRARRVLIVDDDLTHTTIVRRVLANAGYDVEVCTGEPEFDAAVAAFGPELVLMDEQLGTASGAELARRITAIPVLFVTGDHEARRRADVVSKPVVWDELLQRIAERLS